MSDRATHCRHLSPGASAPGDRAQTLTDEQKLTAAAFPGQQGCWAGVKLSPHLCVGSGALHHLHVCPATEVGPMVLSELFLRPCDTGQGTRDFLLRLACCQDLCFVSVLRGRTSALESRKTTVARTEQSGSEEGPRSTAHSPAARGHLVRADSCQWEPLDSRGSRSGPCTR